MKIYYQGFPGAYGNEASIKVAKKLKISSKEIFGVSSFNEVFTQINKGNIGVLPIENSYAGSIHENFYNIISGDYKIVGELYVDINHSLLSDVNDISKIKDVYSHSQALMQCENYLKSKKLTPINFSDTAGAAKFVSENKGRNIASISSKLCAKIYGLYILDENIQDQKGNTTRFFVVVSRKIYDKNKFDLPKANKISLKFKTKDIPAALYKCLGAFATRFINLTKIESLPAHKNKFEYIFWLDFQKNIEEKIIQDALEELKFFSRELVILGDY